MIDSVLREYAVSPTIATDLGNAGGFSGVQIWRIETSERNFCLKRWPTSFQDSERLQWIHRVVRFAAVNGCPEVVVPMPANSGSSFVKMHSSFWELTRWITGTETLESSTTEQLIDSALETTARFHQATARFHFNIAKSKNIESLQRRLHGLPVALKRLDQHVRANEKTISNENWRFYQSTAPALAAKLHRELAAFEATELTVQPVIRDLRADHFFVSAESVTALIDFGAMQIDSIAWDLARLLGSLDTFDRDQVNNHIAKYCEARYSNTTGGISLLGAQLRAERELIPLLQAANPLVGILNWMNWLFVDRRTFESESVADRIHFIFNAYRNVTSQLVI